MKKEDHVSEQAGRIFPVQTPSLKASYSQVMMEGGEREDTCESRPSCFLWATVVVAILKVIKCVYECANRV